MKNLTSALLISAFALAGTAGLAQSWCPPGAEWSNTYSAVNWMNGETQDGIERNQYVGDTLVNGLMCQKIVGQLTYQTNGDGNYITTSPHTLLTRYVNDVVYQWNDFTSSFDTLLCFNAGPGETWPVFRLGEYYRYLVLDTATVVVDGLPLRRSVIRMQNDGGPLLETDTLYERIGLTANYTFEPSGILADGVSYLFRCYRDEQIAYPDPGTVECDFTLGAKEPVLAGKPWLWPNPGTDVLHVLPDRNGLATVTILDARGRNVMTSTTLTGGLTLDSRAWTPGLYQVVLLQGENVLSAKWIKQ